MSDNGLFPTDTPATPIRVLIADDQHLVRGALVTLLGLEDDLAVVADVGTGREVLPAAQTARADVALVDIDMPSGDGFWALSQVRQNYPACRVLMVTTFGRPGYVSRALAEGASGFLVKDTPPEKLAEAIRRVHAGERVIDPSLAEETVLLGPSPLTTREADVLRASRSGADVSEIAAELHLSEGTVRNYASSSIAKTMARNRTEAAYTAEKNGWL
ncbi:response regulator transcription factor [Dermabacteraceae bacterium P7054]